MLSSLRARRRFLPAVLVTLLSLTAVTVGAVVDAQAKKNQTKSQAAKSKSAAGSADCKADADCVAVADDCCPCAQGGRARAIPKKEQAGYEKDRRARCKETACTEMMSDDPSCSQRPFCGAGICELGDPSPDTKP